MNLLEEISKTPDDGDIGYFVEVEKRYPDNIKEITKNCPFRFEKKVIHKDKYNDFVKKGKT